MLTDGYIRKKATDMPLGHVPGQRRLVWKNLPGVG